MAIVNRTLDASQQKQEVGTAYGLIVTGGTYAVTPIAWPCTLVGARIAAYGLSGSPVATLRIQRFIVGAGATTYSGGFTSLTLVDAGTSGIQSVVIAASGSTALNLVAGDVIVMNTTGANTAANSVAVSLVVQATQDIVTHYGL